MSGRVVKTAYPGYAKIFKIIVFSTNYEKMRFSRFL